MRARIVQGDDVDLVFNVKTKDESPVDLAGVQAIEFSARHQGNPCGDPAITKTLAAGITLDSPATQITVTLSKTDTALGNMPAGKYDFDLKITDADGNISAVRDFTDEPGVLEVMPKISG